MPRRSSRCCRPCRRALRARRRWPRADPAMAASEVRFVRSRRAVITHDGFAEDALGLRGTAPAIELDPLALLQVLVVLEVMADALEPMLADLFDVVDVAVAGEHAVDRHREDLLVAAGLV